MNEIDSLIERVERNLQSPGSNASAPVTAAPAKRYGIDAADFLSVEDDDADPYTVAGLIPEGMPTMLVGAPKSRKSWIMLYLAVCIASGIKAFGRPTKRGRVLVIAREDTARETRRRIRLIARALNVTPDQLRGWLRIDSTQPLYLDTREDYHALAGTLAEFQPAVTLIDSLSRIHNRNEDSKTEMALVMNVWSDLCARYSCSVVLLHHVVKWGDGGTLIQKIRGSGDIGAVLRVAIGVTKRDESTSTLETDGNLADLALPFDVRFTDLEHEGRRVAIEIAVASGDVKRDEDLDELIGKIADALLRDGTIPKRDLRTRCKGAKKEVDRAIDAMVARGLIEQVFQGAKACGYKLTDRGREFATGQPAQAAPLLQGSGLVRGLLADIVPASA